MRSFIKIYYSFIYLGFICLKFPDFFVNNFIFSIDLNAKKYAFLMVHLRRPLISPIMGLLKICLDLIGQKAFFLTLLDKCSSRSQVFTMKLIQVS